jgi:hypothetical protein
MRSAALFLIGALAAAPALSAQAEPGMSRRDYQVKMLEHQRAFLLKMADSMPERLYRSKATPAQRDFAGQIHHAAGAVPMIVAMTMKAPKATLPDTAVAFKDRAGLKLFINASFDYGAEQLKAQSDSARASQVSLFGMPMPAWQVWDELYAHTIWTAGQVVANFRENGMAPPAFSFF